ncbi:MAG: hypothetical protein ABSG80_15715 [Verrucomicrobiota bacterium]|jgi:hypothetical protein
MRNSIIAAEQEVLADRKIVSEKLCPRLFSVAAPQLFGSIRENLQN